MKPKAFFASTLLAHVAASTLFCACGGTTTTGAASDAAASHDVEAATVDASPSTDADAGHDAANAWMPVRATQLLDDMRAGPPDYLTDGRGTSGIWYAYSDRVHPWSYPPIFVSDAGVLVPSDGVVFPPTDDDAGPTYEGSVQAYRRCYGGGEVIWGVGFGMNYIDVAFDGGNLAVNDCDAGAIFDLDGGAGDSGDPRTVPGQFDASGWTGIQFWGTSLRGIEQQVFFYADDDTTTPFGLSVDAGGCNSCLSGGFGACGDDFQAAVTFPTVWTHIQVPFAAMHPQGWSGSSTSAVPNVSTLFDLGFKVQLSMGEPALPPFDVAVAYIELYK
jgi:hypothetical protein